jgi:serine protease Do
MKYPILPRTLVLLAMGIFAASGALSQADEIKYADLEKKLNIDKNPEVAIAGVVSSYAPALEKVMPAVVTIFASKTVKVGRDATQEELFRRMFPNAPDDFLERQFENAPEEKQEGLGSGVIISADGYILTNNHVVSDSDEIKVTMPATKKEYPATLIGSDPKTDVALIKIEAEALPTITIGDSSHLRIGDVALAVGNPLGLEQTATIGIISAVGRTNLDITQGGFENFIQTDAAINRGNSGGALVDASGRLIGINTAIQSGMSGGNIGIGFAIPSNMALNIVERLLNGGGVVKRGLLGVKLSELDANFATALGREDRSGALVRDVYPDTPAEKAGFKPGDLIIAYNGVPVATMPQLRLDISNTEPGTEVNFSVVRNGKETSLKAVLGDLEEIDEFAVGGRNESEPKVNELVEGVRVRNLDETTRSALSLDETVTGIAVESVKDTSPAAAAGLLPGTIITMIDQKDVATVDDAVKIVEGFSGDVLLLQVYVEGRRDILALPLK